MSRRPARLFGIVIALSAGLASFAPHLHAQGTLSSQGFGYPPGGLSTRSLGTAGATGEFDLLSSRNPAALGDLGGTILSVQGQPEWRTLSIGGDSERSLVQRMPLVAAGLRVKQFGVMISGATLLDRSFVTESPGSALVDGVIVPTTDRLESRGAMTELRVSAGWNWKTLGLGIAAVAITGEHNVVRGRSFPDTLRFGNVLDSTRLGFQGVGAALGATWRPARDLLVGASWRLGAGLDALRGDRKISSASVPDRLGLGVLYQGAGGTVVAASLEQVGWSAMNGLGTDAAQAQDATNWSVGGEFALGALRRSPLLWRLGYAQRDLPFLLRDLPVSERAFHGGLGLPLAGEFAVLDLSLQRSLRRVQGDQAREDAWGLSAALTIRP